MTIEQLVSGRLRRYYMARLAASRMLKTSQLTDAIADLDRRLWEDLRKIFSGEA